MKLIATVNFSQAIEFARTKGWGRTQFRYVRDSDDFFGMTGPEHELWFAGTYHNRRDIDNLKEFAELRGIEVHYAHE